MRAAIAEGDVYQVNLVQHLSAAFSGDPRALVPALAPLNPLHPEPVTGTPNKGLLAVCTVERFAEEVDGKEFHPGKRVPRFRLVTAAPKG